MPKFLLNRLIKIRESNQKALAVLLDPDKVELNSFERFLTVCIQQKVDFFFLGGSLVLRNNVPDVIQKINSCSDIPVILFPGNSMHIEPSADAILLLSLISGRNSEFLIGQHVVSAPFLKRSGLEILPTGYMLVDSGKQTTVSYISNTTPIPHDKPDVAACTALAGEMLGLKLMYLDGGSGAINPVCAAMIEMVSKTTDCPLIVGGGINSPEKATAALQAGADVIVIGNAFEKDPTLLPSIAQAVQSFK